MTQPTLTVELGYLSGWTLGTSLLGTDTYLATVDYSQDISDLVRSVSIRRGRQHELNRVEAGTASVMVLNQDGAMTRIPPMTSIRIRADFEPVTAPFVPTDISGLIGWFDGDDTSTLWQNTARTTPVTADAQAVNGVTDKSGAAHHLANAGGSGSIYKASIQNGRGVIRFGGSAGNFLVGNVTALGAGHVWTYFVVFIKRGAYTASYQTVVGVDSVDLAQLFTNTANHATLMNWYAGDGPSFLNGVATSALSWGIKSARYNSTASLDIYSAGGTPNNSNPHNSVNVDRISLGADADAAGTNAMDADIGEFLLYGTALSAANMNLVGGYLATRWALTWTPV